MRGAMLLPILLWIALASLLVTANAMREGADGWDGWLLVSATLLPGLIGMLGMLGLIR